MFLVADSCLSPGTSTLLVQETTSGIGFTTAEAEDAVDVAAGREGGNTTVPVTQHLGGAILL